MGDESIVNINGSYAVVNSEAMQLRASARREMFPAFVRAPSLFRGPARQSRKSMGFMTLKVNSTVPIMFRASRMARKYRTRHLINFVLGFKHNGNIRHMLNQRAASHLSATRRRQRDRGFVKPIKPASPYTNFGAETNNASSLAALSRAI